MVTKYPLGTMEGGLAACKRGGRRSNERTNERKDEGNRASRVKREMEVVTSGGAYNCSTTQLLVLGIARSGVPKCFSAVEIPLTLTVSSKGRRIYRVYRRHPARDTESRLALSRKPGFHVEY